MVIMDWDVVFVFGVVFVGLVFGFGVCFVGGRSSVCKRVG